MPNRTDILSLLNGHRQANVPAFSGLLHVTSMGLLNEGVRWSDVHHNAGKMECAAVSTYHLTGMPSVTLPLDLTAPAEALGAELVFYDNEDFQFPQVKRAVVDSVKELTTEHTKSTENLNRGRLPIILNAIEMAQIDVGEEVVISGMLPGPYTLLLYLCNPAKLFTEMKKDPQPVIDALLHLSAFLAHIGNAYRAAGADFITIHEMGGSPGFLGPARYEQFVHPAVKALTANLPGPRVLSVCGDATKSLGLLAESGAEAISLDQLTNLAAARLALKDKLLFGNLDPVATLWKGDAAGVRESATRAREAGVDAVWPGCDMVPWTPVEHIQAMMA